MDSAQEHFGDTSIPWILSVFDSFRLILKDFELTS